MLAAFNSEAKDSFSRKLLLTNQNIALCLLQTLVQQSTPWGLRLNH